MSRAGEPPALAWDVLRHVGIYGARGGDVPASGSVRVCQSTGDDPPEGWALVATCDNEAEARDYARVFGEVRAVVGGSS